MDGTARVEGTAAGADSSGGPGVTASILWIGAMVAMQFVGILLVAMGRSLLEGRPFDPNGLDAVTTLAGLGIGTCMLLFVRSRYLVRELLPPGRTWLPAGRNILMTLVVLAVCGAFTALYEAIAIDDGVMQPENQIFINAMASGMAATIMTFIVGAIIVPIVEELLFRGQLQGAILNRIRETDATRHYMAIGITAAVFAAIHLQALAALPLFVTGFAFGWLRWKTGSLMLPIAGHMVLNAFGLSMILMTGQA